MYRLIATFPLFFLTINSLISDGRHDQSGIPGCLDPLRGRQLVEHAERAGAGGHGPFHHAAALPLCEELHGVQPLHLLHLPAERREPAAARPQTGSLLLPSSSPDGGGGEQGPHKFPF